MPRETKDPDDVRDVPIMYRLSRNECRKLAGWARRERLEGSRHTVARLAVLRTLDLDTADPSVLDWLLSEAIEPAALTAAWALFPAYRPQVERRAGNRRPSSWPRTVRDFLAVLAMLDEVDSVDAGDGRRIAGELLAAGLAPRVWRTVCDRWGELRRQAARGEEGEEALGLDLGLCELDALRSTYAP